MKWAWVLFVVLLVPVSAMAEPPVVLMVIENWRLGTFADKEKDAAVFVLVAKKKDLHNVRGTVRFYLKPDVQIDQIRKARCGIVIDEAKVSNLSEHLINGNHGPELWFSYIPKTVVAELAFLGGAFPAEIAASSFEVTSNEGAAAFTWIRGFPFTQKWISTFEGYQEATLDDVCESYPNEALKGFENPKS